MIRSRDFYRGLVLGLGIMYVLDPDQGRGLRERLRARFAGLRPSSSPEHPDRSLAARVRATLARCVSHPGAIHVDSRSGCILLSGSILRSEVGELIQAISSVVGVTEVVNRLSTHASLERAPSPRREIGGRRRTAPASPEWAAGMRLAAGLVGAAALAVGATRVAAQYRANRRNELEAEMPEYAMLR
jgi:hypothetical protein